MLDANVSRFIWLRQFEVGNNSAAANRLLHRLELLSCLALDPQLLAGILPHRVARLRRQGERYFTDGLRDISSDRRWAILAVCAVEWEAAIADTVVETHDRIIGKTWREAKRLHEERIADSKATVTDTLRAFTALGASLLEARNDGVPLEMAVAKSAEWGRLEQLVATGTQLSNTLADDPLAHVGQGYHRFRCYAPRMLRCLKLKAASVAQPLIAAAKAIGEMQASPSATDSFLRPNSKWHRHLRAQDHGDNRLREVAVLFHLRDAFRSGDIWLDHSRRYGDLKQVLVPLTTAQTNTGLLMNEAGRQVGEQYADTAGFTDHLFGTSGMLGYRLVLRIRDLPSKRLYVFNPAATPKDLRKLVGGKIREELIIANWPDLFRCAATMAAGKIKPSQLLRKLASYPRQNDLAIALREVGCVERTLFIVEWILDTDMQRRAQIGLNKGEAHHALKSALRIGRQGEIRDRTTEGQHYRIAGLNLLTAIIIYWNTLHLGHAVAERRNEGLDVPPELLVHISPLGWAHILLTGEYLWPSEATA